LIKIDWYDSDIRAKYHTVLLKYLPSDMVWHGDNKTSQYRIKTDLLLCGKRSDVLSCKYMELYKNLCIIISSKSKKYRKKELNKLLNDPSCSSFFTNNYSQYTNGVNNIKDDNIIDDLISAINKNMKAAMEAIYREIKIKSKKTVTSLYALLTPALRAELLASLGVECCPYCNRQYITAYYKTPKSKRATPTADIDHFYNKSKFPLFALSLFNFIPACQVCNSRLKGTKWLDALYPFEEEFGDDAVFSYDFDKMDSDGHTKALTHISPVPIPLRLDINSRSQNTKHIKNSNELFGLERIYQGHRLYAGELFWKKHMYNAEYIKSVQKLFSGNDNSKLTESNLYLLLYGYIFDQEHQYDVNRPLSKLTYDLIFRDKSI